MDERPYFHMDGNNDGDYLTLLGDKKDKSVVRMSVGHCCVTAHVRVPIEALTLLLFDLAVEPKKLQQRLRDSGWPHEFRKKLIRKVRSIKGIGRKPK